MAALISGGGGFAFNLLLCRTEHHQSPLSLSSSFSNKFFGDRLCRRPSFSVSNSSALGGPITARYGGSRSSSSGRSSRSGSNNAEVLNMSAIRSDFVRLIDAEQNMFGMVSKSEALRMAESASLDLVIVAPDADPPVVRIMDYNKYRYDQQKKKKEQQKKTNRMDMKELKMGYNIDSHDYSVRLRAAKKFIKDSDKVKVIVNLKGRENEFRNIAIELIRRFQNDVGELASEESKNFRERNINIVLVPNKAVLQKAQEPPKTKEKSVTVVSAGV